MGGQPGFFDVEERYAALSKAGDPLERLQQVVDFEVFRGPLEAALGRSDRRRGGRPPYDPVLMFKALVLQTLYGLSDEQLEFQIRDRLSFMRFLGLGLADRIPDAKTIWLFREQLSRAGAADELFARFDRHLKQHGYLAMSGQIVDASIVAAPRQRMDGDEKAALREGRTPASWAANPARKAQKDPDGRWTLKRGRNRKDSDGTQQRSQIAVPAYGYKNHVSIDRRHGLIRRWRVSDAAAHDGRFLKDLVDHDNTASPVWADTAYRSAANERFLDAHGKVSKVQFRRAPGRELSKTKRRANAARARVRGHVEHVFAQQKAAMGLFVRTIGLARAKTKIGLANITYNMRRLAWLEAGRHRPRVSG